MKTLADFHSVTIGDATLYRGDAMEILPLLPNVDMCATDAPYLLESGGAYTGQMGGKFAVGTYVNDGSIVEAELDWSDFMPLIADILPQGHAYFMCNNRHVGACENAAMAAGFRFHNWLVWKKSTITPNRWYMKNCEFTLFVFRGKAKPISDKGLSQLIYMPTPIGAHPNEKPVPLMAGYIRASSERGQVVLDPFMGSGSTIVAALQNGRKAIGIEKDPKWFDLACERVSQALNQADMFLEGAA